MDGKSKLPKPSGLKMPQVFSSTKPLTDNKQNLPSVATVRPLSKAGPPVSLSRFPCRRSKSVTDLRSLNDRVQSQRLRKPVEPATSLVRTAVKRPACQKTDNDCKPKTAKQAKQVKIPDWDYKTRFQHLNEKYVKVVESLKESKSKVSDLEATKNELEIKKQMVIDLEARNLEQSKKLKELSGVKTHLDNLEREHDALKAVHLQQSHKLELLSHVEADLKELTANFQSLSEEASMLREKVINAELMRRVYHNTIQDLKGNIRVFCRVRPPISETEITKPQCMINYPDESVIEIRKMKESISASTSKPLETKAEFAFDRVFPPDCTQSEFFEELSQLVQSALDGYDVCVFAYGQTGSGKTYTMQGDTSPEHLGMIPRSVNLIFETIENLAKTNWVYTVKVSFLEIYNDNVRDLMDRRDNQNLEICHNEGRGTTVTNLTKHDIHSPQDFDNLMTSALKHRMVAATNFNNLSSRSHAVTKIYLHGHNTAAGASYSGSVNLVDLAGSESARNSHADRLTETKSINKSLSALGTVMLALYNKNTHVPYRNSKLTYLLQSCLGGSAKTLMIVNIPPFEEFYSESINSLRFASKVKQVKNSLKRNRNASPPNQSSNQGSDHLTQDT